MRRAGWDLRCRGIGAILSPPSPRRGIFWNKTTGNSDAAHDCRRGRRLAGDRVSYSWGQTCDPVPTIHAGQRHRDCETSALPSASRCADHEERAQQSDRHCPLWSGRGSRLHREPGAFALSEQGGLRLSGDLALTGYDNDWIAAFPAFGISTAEQDI